MNPYEDIIHLPHHVSKHHPKMKLIDRAAQFGAFSALTGYGEAVAEVARYTSSFNTLDEQELEELNRKVAIIRQHIHEKPLVSLLFFVPDNLKQGGVYKKVSARAIAVESYEKSILLDNGILVNFENLAQVEAQIFD